MAADFGRLRRLLKAAGGNAASGSTESMHARRDEAEYRPAINVDPPLRHVAPGNPEPWLDDVAFLDGTQHAELIGYVGTEPIVAAVVRAAVRLRHDRQFRTVIQRGRHLVVARSTALAAFGTLPAGCEPVPIDDGEESHPIRDVQAARGAIDRARTGLEVDAARLFRASHPQSCVVIDGTLAISPDWSTDANMIGVVKSHAMLPFVGADLALYLSLPAGHRTSLFQPESRRVTPLFSWALRLHDFAGRDLFHGLVRIEAAASSETRERADQISRNLLAERAPISNDARSDRLLYGIHDVERFLGTMRG